MILVQGSRGEAVLVIQSKLNRLGEQLTEDGVFGSMTAAALRRFQSSQGLEIDGMAGPRTMAALDQAVAISNPFSSEKAGNPAKMTGNPDEMSGKPDESDQASDQVEASVVPNSAQVAELSIRKDLHLPEDQFVNEPFKKTAICLHHTEGASVLSTLDYWKESPDKIATAYVVERDGTIFEAFDPNCWAWHLGSSKMLKSKSGQKLNSQTIGIELANEGELQDKDGVLYCFEKPYVDRVWGMGCNDVVRAEWRGGRVWAAYPATQITAVVGLLRKLCGDFSIPFKLVGGLDYDRDALYRNGIFYHSTVREDKTDLHPGSGLEKLIV